MYFALHQQARGEPVPSVDLHRDYVRLLKGDDQAATRRHALEHIDWDFEKLLSYARQMETRAPTRKKPRLRGAPGSHQIEEVSDGQDSQG